MQTPLAELLRPKSLSDFVGQKHLIGKNGPLRKVMESGKLVSMIFWGPPGVGKTTLAKILAQSMNVRFISFSAITMGVKELRNIASRARQDRQFFKKDTIVFIDEIHRFNKGQQDVLLPYVEKGVITLIGATTENPGFSINSPLLSRLQLYVFHPLTDSEVRKIVKKAIDYYKDYQFELGTISYITQLADGDGRKAVNIVEVSTSFGNKIDKEIVEKAVQMRIADYDRQGDKHYDTISAFIKSMRGGNPDATLHYLVRMLKAGEDPIFIARRMVIFASEDIGNIQPTAMILATSCMQAIHMIGMPESELILAQTATYLATAKKSITVTEALYEAKKDIEGKALAPIPLHLRNARNKILKSLGYGKGHIRYPWKVKKEMGVKIEQEYMPTNLEGKKYYKKNW